MQKSHGRANVQFKNLPKCVVSFSQAIGDVCKTVLKKVEIIDPPAGSVPGDRIVFEGYPGEIFKTYLSDFCIFYPIKSVKTVRVSGTFDAMSSNWALHQSA